MPSGAACDRSTGWSGTAEAIAEGHIDERIDVTDPDSEVGRLGTALNLMLDRIGESLAAHGVGAEDAPVRGRRLARARTPLTAIRGYAELYRQGAAKPRRRTSMERIERAATRMGGLVDDLVLLARLDQGRPLEAAPVDLAAVVEDAVADARAVEPGRTVEVGGVTRAMVTGDRSRLRQVVDNLLANVREHTDPATSRSVSEAHRRDVVLVVDDDGPGMTEADATGPSTASGKRRPRRSTPAAGPGLGLPSSPTWSPPTAAKSPSKPPRRRHAGHDPPARRRSSQVIPRSM